MSPVVAICTVLGVPAGWFAGLLIDRVPDGIPLSRPTPAVVLDRRHLAVVVATTALFALAGQRFATAPTLELVAVLLFVTGVVALSVIDIEVLRLPDRIVGPGYVALLGLVVASSLRVREPERIRFAIIGAAVWVVLLGIGWLVGMGFGDVKAGGVYGMVVGWMATTPTEALSLVMWSLILGTVAASLYGVVAKLVQVVRVPRDRRERQWFAFGPFLGFGAVAVLLFHSSFLPNT